VNLRLCGVLISGARLLLVAAPLHGEELRIQLSGKTSPSVEVSGLSRDDLAALAKLALQAEAWSRVFAVYVVPANGRTPGSPILGEYRIESGVLRFVPRFPFVPGVSYRAVLHPASLPNRAPKQSPVETTFTLPKVKSEPARLVHVYPSANRLPENQLKFYFHFSAPMARGNVYRHIHLLDEKGREIELPFLELDEELWDRSCQRLTVFCDPGRIKRGLKPREEVGPVLQEGKHYTLLVDASLEDANGNHLKEAFRKEFVALAPEDGRVDPKTWKLQLPPAGSREPFSVTFPKPLDHALLQRLLRVTDSRDREVRGEVTLDGEETIWRFAPADSWKPGAYQLVVDTRLEDLAGNSIARPFEVDVFHPVQREIRTTTVQMPFEIRARNGR
jgi:hypothetical protein